MLAKDARIVNIPPPEARREERACWLALTQVEGLGPTGLWNLVEEHGSARDAWARSGDARIARSRLVPERVLEKAEVGRTRVVTPVDEEFPRSLLHLHDPPGALYVQGSRALPGGPLRVAVVGSRKATPYGLSMAESLSRDLALQGVVVASGLALGVDGAAHRGSLAGGGPTVAVLGCGLDQEYPREHRRLRSAIEDNGAVVTEYPPGTGPEPWRFPARNRILAGLTDGVVVVQAAERSGALITSDLANEIGREILAVPGPVGERMCVGCLNHLSEGAGLARHARDVLDALKHVRKEVPPPPLPEGDEGAVLEALTPFGASVDTLVRKTGLTAGIAAATLVQLQVQGRVHRLPTGTWIRTTL